MRGTDDGFEVVAGQRRYLAIKKLNADRAPETDTVPCVVMAVGDDAAAIEASLAENVARLPMDEIDQYEAFAALKKQGLDDADIAAHFAISVQVVRRRLAIAGLHPDIRRLYRNGEIDARTLHLLTLATRERQMPCALTSTATQLKPWTRSSYWHRQLLTFRAATIAERVGRHLRSNNDSVLLSKLPGRNRRPKGM